MTFITPSTRNSRFFTYSKFKISAFGQILGFLQKVFFCGFDFYIKPFYLVHFQLSKLLIYFQALAHPWFDGEDREAPLTLKKSFASVLNPEKDERATKRAAKALKRFRAVVNAALFTIRLKALPVTVENLIKSPYSTRIMREQIDSMAFDVYRHWVKRNTCQYRTAMFQHKLHSMIKESQLQRKNATRKYCFLFVKEFNRKFQKMSGYK